MELNEDQKKAMVQQRLDQYKQQLFALQLDRAALLANDDTQGVESTEQRIAAIQKAYAAVEGMA
ncbi:hypothetical protein [Paenibacillus sp. FSL R7-0337]|uniref:hypothetical protein n=1 Tax=Paenibacillus sp. FSL R7-0337 TaxID=1926588 RepID=UPI00096FAC04|nr:hypothetical protein [Paenibacillus sp. FSL R7-0337]OMF98176.1 hypothetical protein BK147_11180 [Paenibacillus sp. FSL R7-0337]